MRYNERERGEGRQTLGERERDTYTECEMEK